MANTEKGTEPRKLTTLVRDIGHDLKMIAVDEIELSHLRIKDHLDLLLRRASVVVVAALVAMIGLGMLCLVVVPALAPVIAPLSLRLLVASLVYLTLGSGAVAVLARRVTVHAQGRRADASELEHTAAVRH